MSVSLLLARLALAAVFAVAALAKLADPAGARASIQVFGAPPRLATPLAWLIPVGELGVVAALLTSGAARDGALGGAALLTLFTAAVVRSLRRGEAPNCHCFGRLAAKPIGAATLARNAGLGALAGGVAIAGWSHAGPSGVAWLGRLHGTGATALGLGLAIAALGGLGGAAFVALLRSHGRLLLRVDELEARLSDMHMHMQMLAAGDLADDRADDPHADDDVAGDHVAGDELTVGGLPVGATAPDFALSGLYGDTVTLAALLAASDRPLLLLFTDPDCGPCEDLLPEVAAWQRRHAATLTIASLSRGREADVRAAAGEHGLTGVLLDPDLETCDAFAVNGTPAAVLVDPAGSVAAPAAGGAEEIAALVDRAVERAVARFGPPTQIRPNLYPATASHRPAAGATSRSAAGGPHTIGSRRR